MTNNQKNNLPGLIILLFCVIGGIIGITRREKLKEAHTIGIVTITDFSIGGRGNAGGVWLDYILNLRGNNYKGASRYSSEQLNGEKLTSCLVGKKFPAVYISSNPSISELLITPNDFSKYGYNFPDSLKWILKYIKNDY